ncbi:hypothetical protein KFL_010250020 [Klebsormidium nitens]|uniref:Reverse transcriptase/retrotransposon-derived protein RNase H-like domain-containing protein n=1 Tax=Klebsormidium nitens TaxID=105231 RepID=A0A1Y1IR09_KLENI|nr:hypothetical protein KFL_010250020 [Klebsormidium nitens]|eukprot:GAQ92482.1 hypothetical protein KFL_010250020 [Klebsormidium nitens]
MGITPDMIRRRAIVIRGATGHLSDRLDRTLEPVSFELNPCTPDIVTVMAHVVIASHDLLDTLIGMSVIGPASIIPNPRKQRVKYYVDPNTDSERSAYLRSPQDAKVAAIVRMVPPRDISELRAFLGTCGYYRRYVLNYARIAAPLNRLLQNGVVWNWVTDEQKAFELLKLKLTEAPVLRRPDFTRPFELHTDWSATGLGAVLAQRDKEGKEYFTLITDHEPLQWLMPNTKLTGMHARWANILQEYDLTIVHRSEVKNLDADGLSRNPLLEDDDWTDARMDHVGLDLPAVSACLAILAGTLSEPEDPELTRLLSPDEIQAPERSLANAPEESPADAQAESPAQPQAESSADAQALAIVAPLREAADDDVDLPVRFDREIWAEDAPVMAYLEAGVYANGVTPKHKDRIWHRAQSYQLKDGVLRKRLVDGETKIVPRPELRANLIRRVHQDVGHYGV